MQPISVLLLTIAAVSGPASHSKKTTKANPKALQVCVVTKLVEIDVPAREQGILDVLEARLGVRVGKGELLRKVDHEDARRSMQI